jgi:hypothetical protein
MAGVSMGRRIFGVVVGLGMVGMGVHQMMRGAHSMQTDEDEAALLARPLPVTDPPRPWDACPPDEVAYASSRPPWTAPAGLDLTAAWTIPQREGAARTAFPEGAAASAPMPRDCSPESGAAFRRLATFPGVDAIAADESVTLSARIGAVGRYMGALVPPAAAYCGAASVDDYQWECARIMATSLRVAVILLPLTARREAEDPSVRANEHWTHGLATTRGAITQTASDSLRLLELPAGVRPGVRLLSAHVLADDFPPVRGLIEDTSTLPALRARLATLASTDAQPDVRETLAVALSRWPE